MNEEEEEDVERGVLLLATGIYCEQEQALVTTYSGMVLLITLYSSVAVVIRRSGSGGCRWFGCWERAAAALLLPSLNQQVVAANQQQPVVTARG